MISSPNHILEMDHLATLFCLQEGEHHLYRCHHQCRITQAALLCTYNKTNAWTISTGLLLMSTVLVRRCLMGNHSQLCA